MIPLDRSKSPGICTGVKGSVTVCEGFASVLEAARWVVNHMICIVVHDYKDSSASLNTVFTEQLSDLNYRTETADFGSVS